jgi:putative intracellular protease/amidase/YHS domain-containing protein
MVKNLLMVIIGIWLFASCKNSNNGKATAAIEKDSADKMADPSAKPKVAIKTVGILLYDGYAVLDAMGPYHVLSELMGANVFFVGRHKGLVTTANAMKVWCDTSIAEVKRLDILVIPGGLNETYLETKDTTLLNWIRAIDVHSKYTTSVCTGAWILAATGLLKDKDATTHWYGKKILADQFGVNVKDRRYVKSGKYWTSAGVSAGIDMSLGLVNDIMGENYTKVVMLDLQYDPQPPFKGGTDENTDKGIVEGVRAMYDGGMQTVLHPEKGFKDIKFYNTKDPVCGMAITASAAVGDTANYNGKVYGFCSKHCKDEFEKNPLAYVPTK